MKNQIIKLQYKDSRICKFRWKLDRKSLRMNVIMLRNDFKNTNYPHKDFLFLGRMELKSNKRQDYLSINKKNIKAQLKYFYKGNIIQIKKTEDFVVA